MSMAATAAAVRTGTTRAQDLVAAALDAAAAAQPALNAFTRLDRDGALRRAAEIDAAAAAGRTLGPLAGVPIAVKDIIDQAGLPTTCGSSFHRPVAASTAPVITRLEAAGAVVIGRTGLHEFAFGFSSENDWFGPVRNPLDPELSPGGSSGGSGAAVGAGIVPMALGTDTGGSVRVPAALCGVVGLKPTFGRVPIAGVFPLGPSLDTVGPLTATVADAALAFRVMAADPPGAEPVVPSGLAVAVPHPWVDGPLDPDVAAGFAGFLDGLGSAGATLAHVAVPELDPPGQVAASANFEVAAVHREWFTADPARYGPEVRRRLAAALDVTEAEYRDGLRWRASVRHALARVLQRHTVIATPTVAARRKPIGVDRIDVGGSSLHYRSAFSRFTAPVNHTGFPALSLPLPAAAVPPPAVQLIALPGGERSLLATARALEEAGLIGTAGEGT